MVIQISSASFFMSQIYDVDTLYTVFDRASDTGGSNKIFVVLAPSGTTSLCATVNAYNCFEDVSLSCYTTELCSVIARLGNGVQLDPISAKSYEVGCREGS